MRVFLNKYTRSCGVCDHRMREGDSPDLQGFTWRNGRGSYEAVCRNEACVALAPQAVRENIDKMLNPVRELRADGSVVTPYEPDNLPILRGMPGARWNPGRKCWTVSVAPADRERVLQAADRMGLDVAPELRKAVSVPGLRAALTRAKRAGAYPFQLDGIRFLASHDRALLADDMGLGKTMQALLALPTKARAILVVPASVKLNWVAECRRWRPDLKPEALFGRKAWRLPRVGEVLVVNYELLPKEEVLQAQAGRLAKVCVVVDEAHAAKNYKAARTKRIATLSALAASSWALTGTPLLNRCTDLYGVLSSFGLARTVFGGWKGFVRCFHGRKEIVNQRTRQAAWVFGGPSADVPERLRRVMLRRMKEDVLDNLPELRETVLPMTVDGRLKSQLDEALEGVDLEDEDLPPFHMFSELRALLAETRVPAAIEQIESYEEAQTPLVVFSAHRAPILEIRKREGWAAILGDTPHHVRQQAVEDFQAGRLKGIAGTIQAMGVGVTLTHAATILMIDLDWTPAWNAQARDRIRRIGQKADKVHVVRMVSDHPLDLHIQNLLLSKEALIHRSVERQVEAYQGCTRAPLQASNPEHLAVIEQALKRAHATEEEKRTRRAVDKVEARRAQWAERVDSEGVGQDPVTPAIRESVHEATLFMLSRCDGAKARDRMGFNKPDAMVMHTIDASGLGEDEDLVRFAWYVCRGYKRQLRHLYPVLF